MSRLRNLVIAATASAAAPALAQCPAPLDEALRLVLVTTTDMASTKGRLQLFTRDTAAAPWKAASDGEPVNLGKQGLAWGYAFLAYKREGEPEKVEGDKRTPVGFYRLGPSFGFARTRRANYIRVEPGQTVCVEDPASAHYNTITRRSMLAPGTKADNMSDTSLFRNGIFVEYPSDREDRRGSCIFIHVWKTPDTATSGCLTMPEPRVKALQAFAEAGAVLGVVPDTTRDRFAGCLPDATAPSQ
jgi:D-alanyl-D-alanine dipeptidase